MLGLYENMMSNGALKLGGEGIDGIMIITVVVVDVSNNMWWLHVV